ncbi:MAG TPA: energy transducer TonB [Vicinamibacterales bacterium]|nr:energy transducer TonB [Vicinamibacterales bacterium]
MNARLVVLSLVVSVVTFQGQQGPVSPDFSGDWALDPARSHLSGYVFKDIPKDPVLPEGVVPPRKVKHAPPHYPDEARNEGQSGTVLLEGIIDTKGHVADLRIIKSIPVFDQAAMTGVWQWQYTPTLRDGKPVEVIMSVTVDFKLGYFGEHQVEGVVFPKLDGAFGTGLGQGMVSDRLSIQHDAKKLTMRRYISDESQTVVYAPGGKSTTNTIHDYGSAKKDQYKYSSRWDAGRLVTEISWIGPQGLRTAREVISRAGDTLTIVTSRPDPTTGGDAFTQTIVYNRRR